MNSLINTYLGQYLLLEVIGRGSTSVVYKAQQPSLNRFVAIKVLLRHLDPQLAARFRREAHAIAQLQHPNILPIYDYGQQDGLHYFVVQYIENGVTLHDLMAGQPIDLRASLRLIGHLLEGLEYAHARGVIHRDIKPSNLLMLNPEWPILADFGIAKLIDDSQELTPSDQTIGTAAYMAPERATNHPVDARSDLYSTGVVLYELVTGQVPFDASTPLAVLMKHVYEPLPPPRSLKPDLPTPVEAVLLRALEKDPQARYQSAREMAEDVQRALIQVERALMLSQLMSEGVAPPKPSRKHSYTTDKLVLDASPGDVHVRPTVSRPRVGQPYSGRPPTAPPQQHGLFTRMAAVVLLVALAGALAAMIGLNALSSLAARTLQPTANSASPLATPAAGELASPVAPPTAAPTATPEPPTPELPSPVPPTPEPPTPVPPSPEPPAPTAAQIPTPIPAAPIVVTPVLADGKVSFLLDDEVWQGGYRRSGGRSYGGRTATWVYGTSTDYSMMRAVFEAPAQPRGVVTFSIEGMDSEDRIKTAISISINGTEIYRGPNPLPDDDHPLETGTWATYSWSFEGALLRPGRNEISISNLETGAFGLPPFFMLDYATMIYSE
jgi:serine/threonine protein kinase